jgi:redox-sensing transcriptional repressor
VRRAAKSDRPKPLSRAAALRLSHYLRLIGREPTVSSNDLAASVGVSDAQVRRDLAGIGQLGKRGIGYDGLALRNAIRELLGLNRGWRAVIVGVGNLARALLRYKGFREQGFEFVGLFDADPAKIGTTVAGLTVEPVERLPDRLRYLEAELGIISVPAEAAQSAADQLIASGIKGLLTFAPVRLRVPPMVSLVPVDLAIQLEQLAFLVQAGVMKRSGH